MQATSSGRLMPQNQPSGTGLLLQRSTAVQVRSSVRLMSQDQVFCRAPQLGRKISTMRPCWLTSLDIFWAGLKDVVWGLVSLSALTQGRVWNANPLQMGSQTTVPCAQAEDSGLQGPGSNPALLVKASFPGRAMPVT